VNVGLLHWVVSANIRLEHTAGISRFIIDILEACPAVGRCSGGAFGCQIGNKNIGVAITSIFVYDEQDLLLQKILSL